MLTTENLKCFFTVFSSYSLLLNNPCLLSPIQGQTIAVNKCKKTCYFLKLNSLSGLF